MRKSIFSLSLLTSLTLVSCSTILNNLPGVYKLEIQQGNIIEQSMIDQLRPGMNKRQVVYIMGSPMLDDIFHKNRWDYFYYDKSGGEDKVQKQLSLYFENDQIVGVQGDFRPSSVPVIKPSTETTVDVPKRDLDKTLWEKITGLFGFGGSDEPDESYNTNTTSTSTPSRPGGGQH
jgi:outer membrane protein assembly factor BamE